MTLAWLGGRSGNLTIAALHFFTAAYVAQTLEINDTNRFVVERGLTYTPFDAPGPASVTIDVKQLIVLFTVITGLFHLIYAAFGAAAVSLRFVEYAITASVMLVIIQLLSGEQNGDLVFACAALTASTMFFGLVQDERLRVAALDGKAFWFGWVPFLAAWFLVIKRFQSTLSASGNIPDFVRAIVWVELALFSSFAIVQYIFVVRRKGTAIGAAAAGNDRELLRYSGAYNALSVFAKLFLAWMAYFGIKSMKN